MVWTGDQPPLLVVIAAARDIEHENRLRAHLAVMERAATLRIWTPTHGDPEGSFSTRRLSALTEAAAAVLLVTPDLAADDDAWTAVQRAFNERPRAVVLPVQVRSLAGDDPLGLTKMGALPSSQTPVCEWPDSDQAWIDVAKGIARTLDAPPAPDDAQDSLPRPRHQPTDTFFARVGRAARTRDPRVRLQPEPGPPPFDSYWNVTTSRGRVERSEPLAALAAPPTRDDVRLFVHGVLARYREHLPRTNGTIVHTGEPASSDVLAEADAEGVDVFHFSEYAGSIDFRHYVAAQTARLEEDETYPPSGYVEQRASRIVGNSTVAMEGAASELVKVLLQPDHAFVLVLAPFGTGKTFLLHEAARRLGKLPNAPVPILIDLRDLEKSNDVGALVAQHFQRTGLRRFDFDTFDQMLQDGEIALLFDGFDELVARVTYARAVEHFEALAAAAPHCAKMVITSRTEHFLTDDQIKKALADRAERIYGRYLWKLEPFDDAEILAFLEKRLDDASAARERHELIHDVKDLLGLSTNPRMLSFIADLPTAQLLAARERHGAITAATLYQLLLERWINFEVKRAHPRGARSGLDGDACWNAVTALAVELWRSGERSLAPDVLPVGAAATMRALGSSPQRVTSGEDGAPHESALQRSEAEHQIGSGTLLIRDEKGAFRFIHRSVMEFLVAWRAMMDLHAAINAGEPVPRLHLLAEQPISPLMADFFADVAELLPPNRTVGWAQSIVIEGANDMLASNARLVLKRKGRMPYRGALLEKHQLSDQDFTGEDFRGADLKGARLSGTRLVRANLKDAVLVAADLSRADLTGADLRGADLRDAELREACFLGADLRGARLDGATIEEAVFIGARFSADEDIGPFRALAAVPPRLGISAADKTMDPIDEVAFTPDGRLVTLGDVVRVWTLPEFRLLTHSHLPRTKAGRQFGSLGVFRVLGLAANNLVGWDASRIVLCDVRSGRVRSIETRDFTDRLPVDSASFALDPSGSHLAVLSTPRGDGSYPVLLLNLDTGAVGREDILLPDVRLETIAPGVSRVADIAIGLGADGALVLEAEGHSAIIGPTGGYGGYRVRDGRARRLMFSADSRFLARLGEDRVEVLELYGRGGGVSGFGILVTTGNFLWHPRLSLAAEVGADQVAFSMPRHPEWRRFLCYSGVKSVAFSPDGRLFVGSGDDGNASVWSFESILEAGPGILHLDPLGVIQADAEGACVMRGDGRYKVCRDEGIPPGGTQRTAGRSGRLDSCMWHVIGRHRFPLGTLDEYLPHLRIPDDEPVFNMPR